MKPFEVGKVYKNGYGHDVRIICTNYADAYGYSIIGLVTVNGYECTSYYRPDGAWCGYAAPSKHSLIPEKDIREFWVGIYRDGTVSGFTCENESVARQTYPNCVRYEKFTYEA